MQVAGRLLPTTELKMESQREGVSQHGSTPGVAFTPGYISNLDGTDLGNDGREDKCRDRKSQGQRAEETSVGAKSSGT